MDEVYESSAPTLGRSMYGRTGLDHDLPDRVLGIKRRMDRSGPSCPAQAVFRTGGSLVLFGYSFL